MIRHSYKQTDRQTDRRTVVKIMRHSYKQTHRQTDTQTDRRAVVKIIQHSYKQTDLLTLKNNCGIFMPLTLMTDFSVSKMYRTNADYRRTCNVHILICCTHYFAPLLDTANLAVCPTVTHSRPWPVIDCQAQQTSPCSPLSDTANLALCCTVRHSLQA